MMRANKEMSGQELFEKIMSLAHEAKELKQKGNRRYLEKFNEIALLTEKAAKERCITDKQATDILSAVNNAALQEKFPVMFSGKISTAMSKVRTCGIVDQSTDSIKINDVQIYKEVDLSKIGVGAAKIFLRIISEFTAHNTQNQDREKLDLTAHIAFDKYAQDNGVDTTSDSAVKKFRFVLHKHLGTLQTILVKWKEKVKGKPMSYGAVNLFSYHEIKNNVISVKLTQEFAACLVQLPIIPVSQSLFAVDNRNANAFAIGYEMLLHYGINNNVMKGTEDKLRVETLLKCTSFETPEDLSKSRRGWREQVNDRFEQALDELTRCGLLKDYCYCHDGGVELSDDEAMNINSYEQWSQLIVKYELNGYSPHGERKALIAQQKQEKQKKSVKTRRRKKTTMKE